MTGTIAGGGAVGATAEAEAMIVTGDEEGKKKRTKWGGVGRCVGPRCLSRDEQFHVFFSLLLMAQNSSVQHFFWH